METYLETTFGAPIPIPVTVLSGFLGSGKTTLLLQMLAKADEAGIRPGIVMNELGRQDVDGLVLQEQGDIPVAKLLDGCVCCGKKEELLEALRMMADRQPEAIVMELTGVANPEEIAETLSLPELRGRLALRRVITVLDAEHVLDYNSIFASDRQLVRTLRRQIEVADLLVLNKTDLIKPSKLDKVNRLARKYNPVAAIVATTHSRIDPELLSLTDDSDADAAQEDSTSRIRANAALDGSSRRIGANTAQEGSSSRPGAAPTLGRPRANSTHPIPAKQQPPSLAGKPPVRGKATLERRQRTLSYSRLQTLSLPGEMPRSATRSRIEKCLRANGDKLLRAKGYLRIQGEPSAYLLQYAGGRANWSRSRYEGEAYLVLIGLDLDTEALGQQWEELQQP